MLIIPNQVSQPKPTSFIDKLGFQFPSMYFNGENYRQFATGDVTIVRWGDWSQLLIHHEAMLPEETLNQAVFRALVRLSLCGVFQTTLSTFFLLLSQAVYSGNLPFVFAFAKMMHYFKFNEMEVSMDFPGIERLATVPRDFKRVGPTSFYSQDYKKTRWGENSSHPKEVKGVQKSFFKIYRKDRQIGLGYPLSRLEFTFSGKYVKYLDDGYLNLTQEDAFFMSLPAIKKVMHQLAAPEELIFNPIALLYEGSPLAQFLKDIAWFPKRFEV